MIISNILYSPSWPSSKKLVCSPVIPCHRVSSQVLPTSRKVTCPPAPSHVPHSFHPTILYSQTSHSRSRRSFIIVPRFFVTQRTAIDRAASSRRVQLASSVLSGSQSRTPHVDLPTRLDLTPPRLQLCQRKRRQRDVYNCRCAQYALGLERGVYKKRREYLRGEGRKRSSTREGYCTV